MLKHPYLLLVAAGIAALIVGQLVEERGSSVFFNFIASCFGLVVFTEFFFGSKESIEEHYSQEKRNLRLGAALLYALGIVAVIALPVITYIGFDTLIVIEDPIKETRFTFTLALVVKYVLPLGSILLGVAIFDILHDKAIALRRRADEILVRQVRPD